MPLKPISSFTLLTLLSLTLLLTLTSSQQISLNQYLPPFLAGFQDQNCYLSGFGQTVSFNTASDSANPIIQDLELACMTSPGDIPFNSRLLVDSNAGNYYYCPKNQSLLVLGNDFSVSGSYVSLSKLPVFDEVKLRVFPQHANLIVLLGLINAPNTLDTTAKNYTESYMVSIAWGSRSVSQVLQLTGAHGEPIVDVEALPENKIVVIGEKVYSCNEKMNTYYMGKWGDHSFNSVVDFYLASSYGFIPQIKATSDGRYLVYTNYQSIFVYEVKTVKITESFAVTLVANNYTVNGQVVMHWEEIPFTLTSEGQETYIFYQGNLNKYVIPDINDSLDGSSLQVQAPVANSTYSRFFFFEDGSQDKALVQMDDSAYLFTLGGNGKTVLDMCRC